MGRNFIPTTSKRKEAKFLKDRAQRQQGNKQISITDKNSKRKVRFGALLAMTPPKRHKKTKNFMVFLDQPLEWGVIVDKVTNALEDLI